MVNNAVLPLVKKLFPFSYSITGKGNDNAIAQYLTELPFTVHEYRSGQTLNGWQIPHAWHVKKAVIYQNDKLIYDATESPLGVGILSPSFSGSMTLTELKKHIFSLDELPDAIPYHWQNLYRPLEKDWAICMPKKLLDTLKEGTFQIDIETELTPSSMKVLDFFLPGESNKTILLNGHNCHPFQANDDLSGCAVGIRVMQQLINMKKRQYSYRLLIAPELHGPMFWLENMDAEQTSLFKGAILLKSVGNNAPLRLQHSYSKTNELDIAAEKAFEQRYNEFEQGEFRAIYGNDETVFESPPYNIPTISLTRWPFPQYHTNLDTPDTLNENKLQDSVELTLDIIEQYEYNQIYKINFKGLVCLSAHGLYKSIPAVSNSGVDYDSVQGRWNLLMNCLPREMDNDMSVFDLSLKYKLPVQDVFEYLELWVMEGLLTRTNHENIK